MFEKKWDQIKVTSCLYAKEEKTKNIFILQERIYYNFTTYQENKWYHMICDAIIRLQIIQRKINP